MTDLDLGQCHTVFLQSYLFIPEILKLSEDLLAATTIVLLSMILYYGFLPAAPYPFQCNVLSVQDQKAEGKVHILIEGNRYNFDLLDMVQ